VGTKAKRTAATSEGTPGDPLVAAESLAARLATATTKEDVLTIAESFLRVQLRGFDFLLIEGPHIRIPRSTLFEIRGEAFPQLLESLNQKADRSLADGREIRNSRSLGSMIFPVRSGRVVIASLAVSPPAKLTDTHISLLKLYCTLLGEALGRGSKHTGDSSLLHLMDRAVASSSNGIILTDATASDNPIIYVNPAFEQITGYSKKEVLGKNCRFLQGDEKDQDGLDTLRKALRNQKECTVVLRNFKKDGTLFLTELSISPVRNDDGLLTHYVGVQTNVTERIMAEDLLRQTSHRLSRLIETLQAGILVEDEHRKIVLVNQEFCSMFGIPAQPDTLIGTDCSQSAEQSKHLFTEPDAFVDQIDELLRNKEQIVAQLLRLENGRSFERDYIPIYVEGMYRGHMWLYRDVSDRVQDEAAIRNLADQQKILLETARSFQSTFAPQQITTIIGETLTQLFTFDTLALYMMEKDSSTLRPVVVRGNHWISDDLDAWAIPVDKGIIGSVMQTGKAENIPNAHEDPRAFYPDDATVEQEHLLMIPMVINDKTEGVVLLNRLHGHPFSDQEFELATFLVAFACISFQNGRLFEMMTERETEMKVILEAIPDMIIRYTASGLVTDLHASEQHTLIAPPRKLIGKDLSSVLPRSSSSKAIACGQEALRTNAIQRMEYDVQLLNETATYELRIAPFSENEVLALATDVSTHKRAEQSLVEAKRLVEESLQAKEEFFARMSHEIRTPMNGVVGLTNLLLNTDVTQQQAEMLRTLKLSADNLLVIINDILDLAKLEAGKVRFNQQPFPIAEVFETIRLAAMPGLAGRSVELVMDLMPSVPEALIGDSVRLTQIVQNLVSNAVKFTEEGSVRVTVDATPVEENRTILTLSVVDTGHGIPADALPDLFETFRQFHKKDLTSVRGTGLGLAIVKQLTEQQSGTVEVQSEEGKGTTFVVTIPFDVTSVEALSTTHLPAAPKESLLDGLRILLVEDDAVNQVVATRTLSQWSITVDVASNGAIAMTKLSESQYDIVLMDIQMPVMNGFDATARIRAQTDEQIAHIPIIAMTASVLDSAQTRVLDAGMDDYISKPFDPDTLHEKLLRWSGRSGKATTRKHIRKKNTGLDLAYLVNLSAGDIKFLRTMVQLYKDESSRLIAQIKEKGRQGRWEEAGRAAHQLKPSVKMVGLTVLNEPILRLEDCAKSKESQKLFDEDIQKVEERCVASYLELEEIDLQSLMETTS
jgi:PAS domain S-box-containing protein